MTDDELIMLVRVKNEKAFNEVHERYFNYCCRVAFNILGNAEDAEECANDTFSRLWNAGFSENIGSLKLYFAKITRNLAIDRIRENAAAKRGSGEGSVLLSELEECIGNNSLDADISMKELSESINAFLKKLPRNQSGIFIRRYFFGESINTIANKYLCSENSIRVILHRIRKKLKKHLEKEELL